MYPGQSPARIPMQEKLTRTDFPAYSAHITQHCNPPLTPAPRILSGGHLPGWRSPPIGTIHPGRCPRLARPRARPRRAAPFVISLHRSPHARFPRQRASSLQFLSRGSVSHVFCAVNISCRPGPGSGLVFVTQTYINQQPSSPSGALQHSPGGILYHSNEEDGEEALGSTTSTTSIFLVVCIVLCIVVAFMVWQRLRAIPVVQQARPDAYSSKVAGLEEFQAEELDGRAQ